MTEAAHKKCACSRNRQCAMHRDQMRELTRKPQQEFKSQRQAEVVAAGIEELKKKYGNAR